MKRGATGTWLPAVVPETTRLLAVLLMVCSMVQSATGGYDGSCLNGLNILPSYKDYFNLNESTTGLNTASMFIGVGGMATDYFGRRLTMFYFSLVAIVGIILQAAAQNVAMFVIARVILGFGSGVNGIASGVYVNETFPSRWRSWGAGMLNNFYYVGALIAAGVTLGSSKWPESTWAWRLPSLLQGLFSVICILFLPFIPESPRWLVHRGLLDAANDTVALANSDGDTHDPVSQAVYREIVDTLTWEKEQGKKVTWLQMFKDKVSRRRLLIGSSPGWISASVGNIIASYFLGDELKTAGVTKSDDQLKANVVLNVWCLGCALVGTQLLIGWGRKPSTLACLLSLIVMLYVIGGLSKAYADNEARGVKSSSSLVYGNVACIFLFQGFYSVCLTPIMNLYSAEILNFSIRANGFALQSLGNNLAAVVLVYCMPIGLSRLGWKMYMINGSWNWLFFAFVAYFWVETKGRTLEEVDELFDGTKHSDVPDVEAVRNAEGDKAEKAELEHHEVSGHVLSK